MQAAQVQLDIAGHNIANVNKPGFSRQRVELTSHMPIDRTFGQIGRGVQIAGITRIRDNFLDQLFRRENPGLGDAELQAEFYTRIEDIFLEPGENGLSGRINRFFDSLSEFSVDVESMPIRQSVVTEAGALVSLFRETAERLNLLRTNANDEVLNFVPAINSLAQRIATLNVQVRDAEVGGHQANDLRDDRAVLLDELSRVVNIFTRERVNGQIDVLVSGEVLVDGGTIREVEAVRVPALDPERNDLVEIRFVATGLRLDAQNGELFGALEIRDNVLVDIDARIDTLAATIIEEVNRIHSQGNGISDLAGTVTSTHAVTDATVGLGAAGLPFPITDGSFDLTVYNTAGTVVASATIPVTAAGTSLNDLAAIFTAVSGPISATVTAGGILEVTAQPGFTFTISNDTSSVMAALGFNSLFTGFDARTIGLNQEIVDDPSRLASAYSTDPLDTGDNLAALDMVDVRNGLFLDNNASTINDFYEATIVQIGIDAQSNLGSLNVEHAFVQSIGRRRLEVSGVSIDEEVTNLLLFQRAFEASARVVTVTNRMLDALMAMGL